MLRLVQVRQHRGPQAAAIPKVDPPLGYEELTGASAFSNRRRHRQVAAGFIVANQGVIP